MDPNANLKEQLELVEQLQRTMERGDTHFDPEDVARLCELVEALDGWIAGGGFLPERWNNLRWRV
jgi:hypothetical protein